MKLLHTADLHLGQILYQNYDRSDEHAHFFRQLQRWCETEHPDVLLVSGDVFDIQYPSAAVKKAFTDYFVDLYRSCPWLHIVITAGNHDSASRIQADSSVWQLANVHLVGVPPATNVSADDASWQDQYIVRLDCGYVVALPYMSGDRKAVVQSLLDTVARENQSHLPVVLMAHQAIKNAEVTGHPFEVGTLRTLEVSALGEGYDYLALGHFHMPQTLGHPTEGFLQTATYDAPVARYSGSALHVSCDETYPHSVSLVEIDRHGGQVAVRQLRIDELRHFYVLPQDDSSYTSHDEALEGLKALIADSPRGYFRFRFEHNAVLPPNFSQMVYDILQPTQEEWRFNPKIIWTGETADTASQEKEQKFEVAELQQMTDPMQFIERTKDQYPDLELEDVRQAFEDVRMELERMREEKEHGKTANSRNSSTDTNLQNE